MAGVTRKRPRRPAPPGRDGRTRPAGAATGRPAAAACRKYQPDIALRSIEGHLTRTGTQVMAWYRLAAQAWSFRSDSQREVLIRQIAAQLGELQGRWLHLRVTTRPYPVHMWAESFDHNALGRMPDVAGALGWDGFLEGEQRHLMGLSMSDKEVFLGIEVSGRSMLDRWVDGPRPVLGRLAPGRRAGRARRAGLRGRRTSTRWSPGAAWTPCPATADDIAWLMHRSCALGLPAPRTLSVVAGGGARWETEDLATFTEGVEHVPGALRADRARGRPAPVADRAAQRRGALRRADGRACASPRSTTRGCSTPTGCRSRWSGRRGSTSAGPEEVDRASCSARWARCAARSGTTPTTTTWTRRCRWPGRPTGCWRSRTSSPAGSPSSTPGSTAGGGSRSPGKDEAEASHRAQQVLDVYRPKVQIEHPEAQYRYAREFIPGEPLASTAYRRRGSVTWAAAAVPAATASSATGAAS